MGIVEEEPCFVVLDKAATAPKIQKQEAEKQQPWQSSGKKNFKRKGRKPEGDAIKGKPFDGNPVRIKEVVEGQKGVIIRERYSTRTRGDLKTELFCCNFYISDRTDSLNCKFFRYSEDAEVKLKKGQWVKVKEDLPVRPVHQGRRAYGQRHNAVKSPGTQKGRMWGEAYQEASLPHQDERHGRAVRCGRGGETCCRVGTSSHSCDRPRCGSVLSGRVAPHARSTV